MAATRKGYDMKKLAIAAMVAAIASGAAAPAQAQSPNCGPRADVVKALTERYGETVQGMGIAGNNRLMELWASVAAGTWTLTSTGPDGMTCLVADGHSYESVNAPLDLGEDG
jgi:hypothetical protein